MGDVKTTGPSGPGGSKIVMPCGPFVSPSQLVPTSTRNSQRLRVTMMKASPDVRSDGNPTSTATIAGTMAANGREDQKPQPKRKARMTAEKAPKPHSAPCTTEARPANLINIASP